MNKERMLAAMTAVPSGLSFQEFIKHPSISALGLDVLMLREMWELYDMYPLPNESK